MLVHKCFWFAYRGPHTRPQSPQSAGLACGAGVGYGRDRPGETWLPVSDITDDADEILWSTSGLALQDLVDTLARPGTLSILQALEGAPARRIDLIGNDGCGWARDTALIRLVSLGLVYIDQSGHGAVRCSLTASGQQLLIPLAGLARWYRENRDQLPPS